MASRLKTTKSLDSKDNKSHLPALNPSFERIKRVYIAQITKADSKPQKIVDRLYLGSVGAAYTLAVLKNFKITHILTLCECLPPKFPNEFEYKVICITDEPTSHISSHFKECLDWIKTAISNGGVVLVHCFAGVSRSSTIIIAYLMRYHNMNLKEAILYAKSKRPWINPNFGFMGQLRRYENFLNNQRKKGAIEN
ncbi:MKP2_3 [Blepharisma stoltei]|uniref:Uncharacterized protein n=1 Tax=Blepharisma stoltei TaxID=1481888 RepID=A0AAU9KBV5_9CILI|nr:unnamed protein product [Blepharisma stoltei]